MTNDLTIPDGLDVDAAANAGNIHPNQLRHAILNDPAVNRRAHDAAEAGTVAAVEDLLAGAKLHGLHEPVSTA